MQVNATMGLRVAFPAQTQIQNSEWTPTTAGRCGTLIAVILDESGSMTSCRDATITGFNEFVAGQAGALGSGEAYLTLVKFDAPSITTVCENTNVKQVTPLTTATYSPGGGTNLMDAIGVTMNRINQLLSRTEVEDRPGVLVVIITDGEENSSKEYRSSQIKQMVSAAETKGDWTFQFLGANVDAFTMGSTFGMNQANTATYDVSSMAATMSVLNSSTQRVRSAKSMGVSTAELYASSALYSDEERGRIIKGK